MELVAVVVGRDDVEQQDVLRLRVEPRQPELQLREDLPATENNAVLNARYRLSLRLRIH